MIEVKITRRILEPYQETKTFETSRKPTEITEDSDYGSKKKVAYETTSEPREITLYRQIEQVVLQQQINEDVVNVNWLNQVICAINGIGPKS